jgi:ABC-type antimicrobial peptide transport system permease subunit
MRIKENLRIAHRSLMASKMRSLLTMLGIIIGVGAIITMISIGRGAREDISERIKSLGTNVLVVTPGAQRRGGRFLGRGTVRTLKIDDAEAIEEKVPYITVVVPELSGGAQVKYKDKNTNAPVVGTTPDYQVVMNFHPEKGSFFSDLDVLYMRRVCVLGKTVVEDIFGDEEPVGKTIRIKNIPFKVLGVMEEKGGPPWRSPDNWIIIPITTAQKRLLGTDYLRAINVQVASQRYMEEVEKKMERVLRIQHKLPANKDNDFSVQRQTEFLEMIEQTSKSFTFLLGSIAAISLIVGGIGIMNIMLVSVTERTREIGIRKSVGAKRRDILVQFLMESLVLSLIGGGIGIAFGIGGSRLVSHLAGWRTVVSWDSISLAFFFSATVGIFFGIYPARKAAKLNPIEALRYE